MKRESRALNKLDWNKAGLRLATACLALAGASVILTRSAALGDPAPPAPAHDLAETSLEDLMNLRVTSVSRKEEPLSKAGS
jgi:hypothetical protein